jgi:hypothetical protein
VQQTLEIGHCFPRLSGWVAESDDETDEDTKEG